MRARALGCSRFLRWKILFSKIFLQGVLTMQGDCAIICTRFNKTKIKRKDISSVNADALARIGLKTLQNGSLSAASIPCKGTSGERARNVYRNGTAWADVDSGVALKTKGAGDM